MWFYASGNISVFKLSYLLQTQALIANTKPLAKLAVCSWETLTWTEKSFFWSLSSLPSHRCFPTGCPRLTYRPVLEQLKSTLQENCSPTLDETPRHCSTKTNQLPPVVNARGNKFRLEINSLATPCVRKSELQHRPATSKQIISFRPYL